MNEAQAAVAYRIMIRATLGLANPGDAESIKNVNTSVLPNGAMCFVIENRSVYRLNKASTAAQFGSSIIEPLSGTGRWLLVEDEDLQIVDPLLVFAAAPNVFPAADTNWTAPNTSNWTNQAAQGFSSWTSGANGIWTYTGPTLLWRLQWDATFIAGGAGDITAGISRNADLAAAATGEQEGVGVVSRTAAIVGRITVSRFVALNTGDVIQPRIRNSAAASVTASLSTLSAVPVQG